MFDIGFLELMVVGILGLLILGPERLPKAARTVGLFVGKIRRTMSNIQDDLERQMRTDELKDKLKDPYATFLDEEEVAVKDDVLKDALAKSPTKEDSAAKGTAKNTHSADKK
ncbi:MAG: twin-arginine translocase subunit TatB [Oleispira sp.]|nr:twin-arginine translocase subunit TatB [Oleispira sp.]MBL4881274.1 twin-arginine translocase subunit TatB [Oleispira sp.]